MPANVADPHAVFLNTGPMPMPLEAGQWVRYGMTQPDGTNFSTTYKVLARRDTAYDFEAVLYTVKGRSVYQYTLRVTDRFDPAAIKVESGRLQPPASRAMNFDANLLDPHNHIFEPHVGPLTLPKFEGAPREDIASAAGKFRGAFVAEGHIKLQTEDVTTKGWYHPQVPIFGLVKSQSTNELVMHWELQGFGTTGAVSEWPSR